MNKISAAIRFIRFYPCPGCLRPPYPILMLTDELKKKRVAEKIKSPAAIRLFEFVNKVASLTENIPHLVHERLVLKLGVFDFGELFQ